MLEEADPLPRAPSKSPGRLAGVQPVEPGVYRITSEPAARSGASRAMRWLGRTLVGPPIPSDRADEERLSPLTALPVLGADCVASSVYGPEEMMRMLALAGAAALWLTMPVALAIVLLLALLTVSYRQTIQAYPSGAGGYVVAGDNLGRTVGLVAAAALLIDYTLDVAVSVATGVQSLTSAIPGLADWRVSIALAALALLTIANLRGIRTSGLLFSAPIYVYILGTLAVLSYGMYLWTTGSLPAYEPPPAAAEQLAAGPLEALGFFLVLRAFSSGAVALTGVEAISNGVPYFREPSTTNARRTMLAMSAAFALLFLGIAFVGGQLGVVPDPSEVETVLSQLTRTLIGRGAGYLVVQGASIVPLVLAANTGFADFPRLLSMLAHDRYLPKQFATRSSRLSFGNGILLAALVSAGLIVMFGSSVAALVPLFTVGAILTFTLSQAGMVRHWWTHRGRGWRTSMAVNLVGAVTTAVVLVVVVATKFAAGAWVVVVVLPVLVVGLRAIGSHNRCVDEQVALEPGAAVPPPAAEASALCHHVVIPVDGLNRVSLHGVAYALSVSAAGDGHRDAGRVAIEALHVTDDRAKAGALRERWARRVPGVPLVVVESPYRAWVAAVLRYLDEVDRRAAGRATVTTVVVPEAVPARWWHKLLHKPTALQLKGALLFRPGTVVVSVPYHLEG